MPECQQDNICFIFYCVSTITESILLRVNCHRKIPRVYKLMIIRYFNKINVHILLYCVSTITESILLRVNYHPKVKAIVMSALHFFYCVLTITQKKSQFIDYV